MTRTIPVRKNGRLTHIRRQPPGASRRRRASRRADWRRSVSRALKAVFWSALGVLLFHMAYGLAGSLLMGYYHHQAAELESKLEQARMRYEAASERVDAIYGPRWIASWAAGKGMVRANEMVTLPSPEPVEEASDGAQPVTYASVGAGLAN